jgi:hypothetical protein
MARNKVYWPAGWWDFTTLEEELLNDAANFQKKTYFN